MPDEVLAEVLPAAAPAEEPEEVFPDCPECGLPLYPKHVHLPLLKPKGPPPQTRGDCLDGGSNAARPCGWLTCKYWLYSMEAGGADPVCQLDVADQGGLTLEEVGAVLGVTRERVRQIEEKFLKRLRRNDRVSGRLRALLHSVESPEG